MDNVPLDNILLVFRQHRQPIVNDKAATWSNQSEQTMDKKKEEINKLKEKIRQKELERQEYLNMKSSSKSQKENALYDLKASVRTTTLEEYNIKRLSEEISILEGEKYVYTTRVNASNTSADGMSQVFSRLEDRSLLEPRFDRKYGEGHTHWVGALEDGINRGGYPYYCPSGWERVSLKVDPVLETKSKSWALAYHGTAHGFVPSILESKIRATPYACDCANGGEGAYVSPCIEYCAHPRYAQVYDNGKGQFVQVVLMCRVNQGGIKKKIYATLLKNQSSVIDCKYSNKEMEWVISPDNIVCVGLMVRASTSHPDQLPSSCWWKECHGRFGQRPYL